MTIEQKVAKLRSMLNDPNVSDEMKNVIGIALAAIEANEGMIQ